MTEKTSSQPTLKKLMQIIYEKEKEVDRYRKKLREKERNKLTQQHQRRESKNPQTYNKMGLTHQEKDYITREIVENKKILEMTANQLCGMEARIEELKIDLEDQQNRNKILEQQLYEIKMENESKDRTIQELQTVKQLLQNVKINKNGEITQKQVKIQQLIIQNQKIKLISDHTKQENIDLKQKMRNLQTLVNKQLKQIHKNLRYYRKPGLSQIDLNSNCSNISLGNFAKRSEKQIKTHTFIHQKLEQPLEEKIKELLEMIRKWEEAVNTREEEWRKNFEKGLVQHSIDGISGLISDSIMIGQEEIGTKKSLKRIKENNFCENSQFKRNESQFLKQLEKECQKQIEVQQHVQKQKQIELAEARQSLRMTKQINEQLFDDLNKQENVIKMFKQTFKSLEDRKLLKPQVNEDLKKLKNVLGIKTF